MSGRISRYQSAGALGGDHAECIESVHKTELPPSIIELSAEYDRCIGTRDEFLWKWIHGLFDAFTLPCVPSSVLDEVKTTKTVFTMYITALDDLTDHLGDEATFEQARRLPHAPESVRYDAPGVDTDILRFAETLWNRITDRLTAAPRYEEHLDVFIFDVRQALNAMEYARVLNDNKEIANLAESRHHGPFNMVMFPYAGIDLMWTPSFDRQELGQLRSLLLDLQRMARIGNWITTWKRELYEDDYTAGVVIEALERGLITVGDDPERTIARIDESGIVEQFELEWETRYADAMSREYDIKSFDVRRLVDGMRTVMEYHVASYGQK
ncbi:hypothetical protein [Halogeometricum borinquense]|uniref:hypothetical protein n=1 Tax=Halogeometricum borinquense TaxID=60847 RepID=UPI00342AB7D2